MKIKSITAREILDSRGYPTVETEVCLESGTAAVAMVPSGASTGQFEAVELRDGERRMCGKGVLKAVEHVNNTIAKALVGQHPEDQEECDRLMIELDGTHNKAKLGANAILSVSMALCKAVAADQHMPLYTYLAQLFGTSTLSFPRPMMNILNGGMHADNKLDIQEFMIIPASRTRYQDYIEICCEVYQSLKKILKGAGMNTNVGDEGGFAPQIDSTKQALDFICQAVEQAGYKLGEDVQLALDVAASELLHDGLYCVDGEKKSSEDMVSFYEDLIVSYPIISIEDPLGEEDWAGFQHMMQRVGDKLQIVGDDLFVTNVERLKKGIEQKAANAILIKLNQIGTLSETISAIKLADQNGVKTVISHRSGETTDTFIADLSVAARAPFIKTGAPARGERVAKYNRLTKIACEVNK